MTFQKKLKEKRISFSLAAFTSSLLMSMLFLQTPTCFAVPGPKGCLFTAWFKHMAVHRGVHYYDYKGFHRETPWVRSLHHVTVCVQKNSRKPIKVISEASAGDGTYTYKLPNYGTASAPDFRSITAICEHYTCAVDPLVIHTCNECQMDDIQITHNLRDDPPLSGKHLE